MASDEISCRVISLSRRSAQVLLPSGEIAAAKMRGKSGDPVVGDYVRCREAKSEQVIEGVLPRKNVLSRTYRDVSKELVANIDLLFIVAAVGPLFNTTFIDRVLAVAHNQEIPAALIINKSDIAAEEAEALSRTYGDIGLPVYVISAKFNLGMDRISQIINNPDYSLVAFAGVSGVGKSTLINNFVPGAKQRTAEVSEYTGLGKQTTTLALAHRCQRQGAPELLLVDLPGVQNFGVTHLDAIHVASSFPEFESRRHLCRYGDCLHLKEDECAVKTALENGEIRQSRYDSYVGMITEIEAARPY